MSAIVGERDKALRSTIPRNINPTAGKVLLLDVDPSAVHFDADGNPTTPIITFTARPLGFDATVLWSITNGGALAGTGKNVRTMAASSMSAASVKVTITAIFEGQAYISVKTIYKVSDGKAGTSADPADLSPEALVAALEGRIVKSSLYADLRTEINLITDPVSVPGSVQARVKAETDARVAAIGVEAQVRQQAIGQEVADRIAAVLAEAGARETYVQNYTFSQQQINSALSIQATQIAAAATAYTDQKTGTILSTAAADVRNYSYSKADTTSAISAAETRLRAEFVSSGGATEAFVQNWSYSKAQSDSAEATQTATLTTSYQGYADQKKAEAKVDAAADVRNYAYSKSAIDNAEAAQSATLTTNYTAYADTARAEAVSTASADVRQYAYSKSDTTSAIAAAESRLRAEFVSTGGATEGYVTNYAYSKAQIDQAEALQSNMLTTAYKGYTDNAIGSAITNANAFTQQYAYAKSAVDGAISSLSSQITASYLNYTDNAKAAAMAASAADIRNYSYSKAEANSAIAQSTTQLTSTVGSHTTTLQQQAQSINGLSAQYTVKIDNNGRISGFGLASTPVDGVAYSAFIINADAFSVGAPGVANKQMFTVGQVKGQTAMVLRGDMYADGDITARMLKIGTSDNIVPDPAFHDLGWWGRAMTGVAGYWADNGQTTPWLAGASLYLNPSAGESISYSLPFPITPGAIYSVQCQVALSDDFNGRLSVFWTIPGAVDHSMVDRTTGLTWGDGLPVQLRDTSPKGIVTFTTMIVVPAANTFSRGVIQLRNSHTVGTAQVGSISITRVVDSTLIGPGSVETKHMTIANGGHIASGMTGFDVGNGWWLEGALPGGHGARFAIGDSQGRRLICDPQNNIMKIVNFEDGAPQFHATITNSQGLSYYSGPKSGFTFGVFNVTTVNGVGPYSISWSVNSPSLPTAQASITTANNGTQVIVRGISSVTGEFDFYLDVSVVGSNGKTSLDTFLLTANFT